MKQIYFFILILLTGGLAGCKKSGTSPSGTSFSLLVNNGVGSGSYKVGDTAYAFSNAPSSTQVFDKWTGDISALANPSEWRTTLKMPASNVNITANYKTVANIIFTNVIINGSQVYYYIPATYRGIVMPFHGTGGSASNWAVDQAENVNFCRYAAANGYAVVITESTDRVNMMWDLSASGNVDIANINTILQSLQTSGIIASGKPIYGLGMSNGSAFCSLITYLSGFRASALYCYGGIQKVFLLTSVPTIWNMAAKDITEDPSRQIEAQANYATLSGRGIPCVYYLNNPTPLYPLRFTIAPGISSTGSTSIFNALKAAGYLDANNFLNIDPSINTTWQAVIPAPYNVTSLRAVEDQLYVAYAQHKFYKDSNYRTIQFFNRF